MKALTAAILLFPLLALADTGETDHAYRDINNEFLEGDILTCDADVGYPYGCDPDTFSGPDEIILVAIDMNNFSFCGGNAATGPCFIEDGTVTRIHIEEIRPGQQDRHWHVFLEAVHQDPPPGQAGDEWIFRGHGDEPQDYKIFLGFDGDMWEIENCGHFEFLPPPMN